MARAFEFRLEPLLDRCRRTEDERHRSFAECRRALDACDVDAERLAGARAACRDAADLRLRDAYLRHLDGQRYALDARRRELRAQLDRSRQEYVGARRERQVLEKLKDRRRRDFEAEQARREELELDDANARRHERSQRKRVVT